MGVLLQISQMWFEIASSFDGTKNQGPVGVDTSVFTEVHGTRMATG